MSEPRYWAVIPAAGVGSRMQADRPKQYLPLLGQPILQHTLERFTTHPGIAGVFVAVSERDPYWPEVAAATAAAPRRVNGGAERCHSVLNALRSLQAEARADDWVLVHDAARPCLRRSDLDGLMDALREHPVGGLLGLPVRDTMKRSDAQGEILETVSRDNLWHALTPQMFRFAALSEALEAVVGAGGLVTDEAQAMEQAGHRPRMVAGHPDNIKLTHPQDLPLAEMFLRQQQGAQA